MLDPTTESRQTMLGRSVSGGRQPWSKRCGGCFLSRCFGARAEEASWPNERIGRIAGAKQLFEAATFRYDAATHVEAQSLVPPSVVRQFWMDLERSFHSIPQNQPGRWGWPGAREGPDKEACMQMLVKILTMSEYKAQLRRRQDAGLHNDHGPSPARSFLSFGGSDGPSHYVQGCNLLAAMCLGFSEGREEDCFWLLLHLEEDVLGDEFFGGAFPLLGFHGDLAAIAHLISLEAPTLTRDLGPKRLADAISAIASRCILSGFVGILPDQPLISLWEELLEGQSRYPQYPRYPLVAWMVGIVKHFESDLTQLVRGASPEELVPLLYKKVIEAAGTLEPSWRPRLTRQDPTTAQRQLATLRQYADLGTQRQYEICQERRLAEAQAQRVWQSLNATSDLLRESAATAQRTAASSA